MFTISAGLEALVGGILLLAGRRLFWLFVAGVGFVVGLGLARRALPGQPEELMLLAALLVALLGAMLALFVQKAAIGLVGFFAGGWLALWLLHGLGADAGILQWAIFIIGGIIGVVLLAALFEWGLILLSALIGASLLTNALIHLWPPSGGASLVIYLLLFGVGILIQARSLSG
ncbi:MAG: hypothetical protein ACP5UQ_12075 [Anaerolineae bacterium]